MVSACAVDTYNSSDFRSFPDFCCFGRGRRTPSSQGNGSSRSLFHLPSLSPFRSSRLPAEHSYSNNQNQSQPQRRAEHNDPLNDPPSTWSNYSTMGQQSPFPNDDDPRLQYSYPAPQQVSQPYQPYRDPSTSYSNHHPILPPINVSEHHTRGERWQQDPYGSTSPANRVPETVFSPVASYPATPFQYQSHHHSQGILPEPRFPPQANPSSSPSSAAHRRGLERTITRTSATVHPYPHPTPEVPQDQPPPKKKRKRADAEQLRVLNEVYDRTAFPSTEERQELAVKLNMTPRSVQIWFQNKRQQRRNLLRQSASVRGQASGNPSGAHHGGSSRSLPAQGNVSTVPMPLHQPGSVSSNPHQTTYSPSPTDTAYFPLSRPLQPQQGTSTHYRSPSRNFDDFHDGGSSRRNRV